MSDSNLSSNWFAPITAEENKNPLSMTESGQRNSIFDKERTKNSEI